MNRSVIVVCLAAIVAAASLAKFAAEAFPPSQPITAPVVDEFAGQTLNVTSAHVDQGKLFVMVNGHELVFKQQNDGGYDVTIGPQRVNVISTVQSLSLTGADGRTVSIAVDQPPPTPDPQTTPEPEAKPEQKVVKTTAKPKATNTPVDQYAASYRAIKKLVAKLEPQLQVTKDGTKVINCHEELKGKQVTYQVAEPDNNGLWWGFPTEDRRYLHELVFDKPVEQLSQQDLATINPQLGDFIYVLTVCTGDTP